MTALLIRAAIGWLITGALLGGCVVDYAGGVRYRDHFYLFSGHCLSEEAVDGAPFDVGRAWLFGYRGTPARAINGIGTDLAVAVDSDAFDPPPCPHRLQPWQPAVRDDLRGRELVGVLDRLDELRDG